MNLIIKNIMACILLVISFSTFSQPKDHYVIFVDAGSTGSRLHVFKYDNTQSLPLIQDVLSVNVKPGLSAYANQPEAAGPALNKLFSEAAQYLQSNEVNLTTTSINIFGTAGMRALSSSQQEAIYTSIKNHLKVNYSFNIGKIETISGLMEGVYGWLDVNYLLGNFKAHAATVGSIDMGGGSTQITYAILDEKPLPDAIKFTINNQPYHVFTKSFMGMGQDEARNSMTKNTLADTCFPKNYTFAENRRGSFNFHQCAAIYNELIRQKNIVGELMPITGQSFVAYSGIYFAYNFFEVDKTPDQQTVETRVKTVCQKTWEDLQKAYPTVEAKYLSTYCANAAYHGQLLYYTYGLTGVRLNITNKINQQEIDWTLGAALYSLTQN